MKKHKYFSLVGVCLFLFMLLMMLTSCGKETLNTPTITDIDINYKMKWSQVTDARSYVINIVGVDVDYANDVTVRKTNYSLAKLVTGNYEIKIKAIGGANNDIESAWSEVYSFKRDYESGCIYTLINNNSEYEITKSGSASGDVIIDATYRGKPVTRIGEAAFKGNGKIDTITLPEGLTVIGKNAFYNCASLTTINLPSTVTEIGEAAFQSCRSLESIEVPSKVKVLEKYTFAYCRALTSIILNEGLEVIGESAISECSQLKSITIPQSVREIAEYSFSADSLITKVKINSTLKTIPAFAFSRCTALEEVEFSDDSNLIEIGENAFSDCQALTQINLPDNLETIGARAFNGCVVLDTISIPTSVTKIGLYCFNNTKLYTDATSAGDQFIYADDWVVGYNLDYPTALIKIDQTSFKEGTRGFIDGLFANQKTLMSVVLNKSIKILGEYCFAYCSSLYSFVCKEENGLEYIWNYAFMNDSVLSNLSLKEGLIKIGARAFSGCSLIGVAPSDTTTYYVDKNFIPNSVKEIGTYAFYNTGIWNRYDEYGVKYAGKWVVGCANNSSNIQLSGDLNGIADYAFYECDALKSIVGVNNAKYIGTGAFYKCSNLSSVQLNKNLKEIKNYTFYKCSSLFSVVFPTMLQSIGERAFYGCSSLNEVDLSSSRVTEIGLYSFGNCSFLQTVSLPRKYLTTVNDFAFYKCGVLEKIILPDTVTYLGEKAFYKCETLANLTLSPNLTEIKGYTFYGCSSLKEIIIPDSVKIIGEKAFYKCTLATKVELGNNIESIEGYAFFGLENVSKVKLPTTLKKIGAYAFKGWNSLNYIYLDSKIDTIEKHAFYGCNNLSIYTNNLSQPENWHKIFNSSYRPVIYQTKMSEDGSYVVSITTGDSLVNLKGGLSDPQRDGYTFGGWSYEVTNENNSSETVIITSDEIVNIAFGISLNAVWNKVE